MTNRNRAIWASTALLTSLAMSTAVYAQETTGAIRGQIVDSAGVPLANASVTIVHAPTGTSSTTITAADGTYAARNLRVGGPYVITVSAPGVDPQSAQLASIGIGAPSTLDILVTGSQSDATTIEEVVVTGSRAGSLRTSPRTQVNAEDIETLPSISRDIKDFVRTSPFASIDPTNSDALIIGGQNSRFNAFLVDGIRQGDDFGLASNGYPTQRSPISVSLLQAVSVDVAPYDVQYGAFTGGVVNSVTKSGGNQFHGELFYEQTDDSLRGDKFSYEHMFTGARVEREQTGVFKEKTWGATLSGPILKDRLFFILNYEKFEATEPVLSGPSGSGAVNEVPGITQADVDAVRTIMRDVYKYDPLDWQASSLEKQDEKIFAKIDWNITDRHRAAFSYQRTEGNELSLNGTSTSATAPTVGLLSQAYSLQSNLTAYKAQLFSDWTDNFSTELSLSRKEVENISSPLAGNDFAQFKVWLDPVGTPNRRAINLGTERSRHANMLTNDLDQIRFVAKYQSGEHRLTAGYERETVDVYNVFVQDANGQYEFNSLADLRNRTASRAQYANAASNNKIDGGASFATTTNSLFVQDEWDIHPRLTLRAGARFDWYETDDAPKNNPAVLAQYGIANDHTLDGVSLLQPRFGFNWRPTDSLNVYGGIGLFSGGSPNVWVSNNYTNTGNLLGSFSCSGSACAPGVLQNIDGFNPSQALKDANTAAANRGTGVVNLISPAFKVPSIWKTSLGANQDFDLSRWGLGEGWNVRAEYVHSEVQDAVGWVDLNSLKRQSGVAPDGRPVFFGTTPANNIVLMLTNFDEGKTDQFAIGLNKGWQDGWLNGLSFDLSYTYVDSKDIHAGTSSVAASNYGQVAFSDPNNPELATSNYQIKHTTKLNLSYNRNFFGDNRTSFHLFGQRRSGLPYSYTFNSNGNSPQNMFGENSEYDRRGRQLLYVPAASNGQVTRTSDPRVTYAANFDMAAFNTFLQQTGLINQAGQITRRNAYKSPDVTVFDLRITQEIPAFFPGGAKLELYWDIENLGNLLNEEWGTIQQVGFPYFSRNITARNCQVAASACAAGVGNFYQFDSFGTTNPSVSNAVWQMKLGVRYKF